jgi:DNA end-binding protein Ku
VTALRSLWNGTLRVEAVQVPVALAATRAGGDVSLRTLHRPCSHPMVQQLECPIHGQVPAEELVSGWEVAPGEYVLVETEELPAATSSSRTIDVLHSFDVDELDVTLVRSSYWLMPIGGAFARDWYATISDGLGRLALRARLNYRGEKEAVIRRADGRVLLLQVLAAVEDRHPASAIAEELGEARVKRAEAHLARQLIKGKLQPLDESLIVDSRRRALRALLEQKLAAGAETVTPEPAPVSRPVPGAAPADLGAALRRSVEQLQGRAA